MTEIEESVRSEEQKRYELKWAGEKDAVAHCKKQCAKDRRKSFSFRNQEGKKQKVIMTEIEDGMRSKEHESYELKLTGERCRGL